MSDLTERQNIAAMFAAVVLPKVIEGGGLFEKKYIRLGPLYLSVMGWMFQCGGILGYGLRGHSVILAKLIGIPADRANDYVQNELGKLAADQLAKVSGKNKTLTDLFLHPVLAEEGYELTPGAKWINTRIYNEEDIFLYAQIALQQGMAVSFHFPKDFRIYWVNSFKPKPQKEWDEAYRRGIVATPQQKTLILEDEVQNTLADAIDWVRESAPAQLTSNELSILEKLASSS